MADKLDILDQRLDDVDTILVKQEANLAEHMKRTNLLEQQQAPLNKFMWATLGIISFITFFGVIVGVYSVLKGAL